MSRGLSSGPTAEDQQPAAVGPNGGRSISLMSGAIESVSEFDAAGSLDLIPVGGEVTLTDPQVLNPPEFAQVLMRALKQGLTLRIDGLGDPVVLRPAEGEMAVLDLIARHHERWPHASTSRRGSRLQLSRYQLRFIRTKYRQGVSAREIGMLFCLSPAEVLRIVDEPDRKKRARRPIATDPE